MGSAECPVVAGALYRVGVGVPDVAAGSAWACRGATLRRSTVDSAPAARVRDNVMVDLEDRGDEGQLPCMLGTDLTGTD